MQSTVQTQLARNLYRSRTLKRSFHITSSRNNAPFSHVSSRRHDCNEQFRKLSEGIYKPLSKIQPSSRRNESLPMQGPHNDNLAKQTSSQFDLSNRVYITSGGARGLGLAMAECAAGRQKYCAARGHEFFCGEGPCNHPTADYYHSPTAGHTYCQHYLHSRSSRPEALSLADGRIRTTSPASTSGSHSFSVSYCRQKSVTSH